MDCNEFNKLIDGYLDGDLSAALLAEFHAHRLACRRCGRVLSMLQAAGDVIAQDRSEPQIGADFADRVLAELPAVGRANRSLWLVRLTAGTAGLAAAAAIAVAVFVSGQLPMGSDGGRRLADASAAPTVVAPEGVHRVASRQARLEEIPLGVFVENIQQVMQFVEEYDAGQGPE